MSSNFWAGWVSKLQIGRPSPKNFFCIEVIGTRSDNTDFFIGFIQCVKGDRSATQPKPICIFSSGQQGRERAGTVRFASHLFCNQYGNLCGARRIHTMTWNDKRGGYTRMTVVSNSSDCAMAATIISLLPDCPRAQPWQSLQGGRIAVVLFILRGVLTGFISRKSTP
jgi:hypothetical protein